MSHSTLTWYSSAFKPTQTNELFVITGQYGTVHNHLYIYDTESDSFRGGFPARTVARKDVGYWAYVPYKVEAHKEEKQSQVPT